ncbi:MAG: hypothetical protein WCW78_03960 [Candidatus Paceibacterota bacterium]
MKKALIIAIIGIAVLLGCVVVYSWSTRTSKSSPTFKGPTGTPFVKGPSGPPPGQ